MKPLYLKIQAFGPFGKTEKINFEKVGQQGLFLISGDTGSGKTSIFDAISFVLYGNASGENRGTETMRSDYAKDISTAVELKFLHLGKEYWITRTPAYWRSKKKGNGLTMEKAEAALKKPDGTLVTGYSNVTENITELIGMDWKQFKQISMIAQGEFMRLLTADSKERGEIFRKVFGTERYADFQKHLSVKTNEMKKKCIDADRSILQYFRAMQIGEKFLEEETLQHLLELETVTNEQVLQMQHWIKRNLTLDQSLFQEKEEEKKVLYQTLMQFKENLMIAEESNRYFLQLEQEENKEKILREQELFIEEKRKQYESGKRVFYYVQPKEELYLQVKKEEEECKLQYELNKKFREKLLQKKEESRKEKEAAEEKLPTVELLKKDLLGIEKECILQKQLEEEYKKLKLFINDEKEIEEKNQECEQKNFEIEQKKIEYMQKMEESGDLEKELLLLQQLAEGKKKEETECRNLLEKIKNCTIEETELKKQQKFFLEEQKEYEKNNALLQEKESLFFREQAGILAKKLERGKPCPVCGALEHPDKAQLIKGAPTEIELEAIKKSVQLLHEKMSRIGKQCAEQNVKVEEIFQSIKEQTGRIENFIENLRERMRNADFQKQDIILLEERAVEKIEQLSEEFQMNENNIKKIKEQQKEKEKTKKWLHSLQKEQEVLQEEIERLRMKREQVQKESAQLQGMISSKKTDIKYGSLEEVLQIKEEKEREKSELEEKIKKAQEIERKVSDEFGKVNVKTEERKKALDLLKKKKEEAENVFQRIKQEQGFLSEENYQNAKIEENRIVVIEKEIQNYEKERLQNKERLQQLKENLRGREKEETSVYQEKIKEVKEKQENLEQKLQKIYSRIENNKNIFEKLEDEYEKQKQLKEQYISLSVLSETANGALKGKPKISFEQYVQAFYFDHIIYEANKRLYQMSSSQYRLRRKEIGEADEKGKQKSMTGLELEVMDYYTGKARSVKSLSGGETFEAALSMALGLSDVIQRYAGGIQVDAMFIDEGFGSLDSDSLEQAMGILHTLTNGNRLVGIISHVNELKERIDNQILVKKEKTGSKILGL